MLENKVKRDYKFIEKQIGSFNLDLSGLTIFTELGTNNYAYTPIICALSGAEKVYAISNSSQYGTLEDNIANYRNILDILNISDRVDMVEIVTDKKKEYLKKSDIITNLGFLRPITQTDISYMKSTSVIPLMYETWEFRNEDIDINACKEKEILVLGVNEEKLDILNYSGFLACKMLFDVDCGVCNDTILLLGSGRIGKNIANFFCSNKINFVWINYYDYTADHSVYIDLFDVIIVAEMNKNTELIGKNGFISIDEICKKNPLIQIVHICGNIDSYEIRNRGISLYPEIVKPFGYMSETMNNVDPKATIKLIVGGLKTGEIMVRNRLKYDFNTAYTKSISNSFIDDFKGGYVN